MREVSRRQFMKVSGASALAAGLPAGWVGGVYASDAPETPKVRLGIIALTDCSSIVMAHELGLFKKHGIESTISKEASWAVIRDRLTLGENQIATAARAVGAESPAVLITGPTVAAASAPLSVRRVRAAAAAPAAPVVVEA